MSALRVELVSDHARLRALRAPLQRLFAEDTCATPFQSPDWWLPWAEHFAAPRSLRVLIVWGEAARVLVCLPLAVRTGQGGSVLGWLGEGVSDYLDALVADDAPAAALKRAVEELRELARDGQHVELSDVPAHSRLLSLPPFQPRPHAICPTLRPDGDIAAYRRALPHGLLRTLYRSERNLQQLGPVRWQRASDADVQELLAIWFELHELRWAALGQPGVLAHPAVQAFHRAAAGGLLARGLLALDVLWLAARPLAACYLLLRGRCYLYLSGYVPDLPRVSLGSVTLWHVIEQALEGGAALDFLRGQEPYKYLWGAVDTSSYQLRLDGAELQRAAAQAARGGSSGSASPSSC